MHRRSAYLATFSICAFVSGTVALGGEFKPVTDAVLANPDPADWLMINRTLDQQRFSPLDQINKSTVGDLRMAWTRGMPAGTQESTPMVYNGLMYLIEPGANVEALNAVTGDLVWEYRRKYPDDLAQKNRAANLSRGKNLAMFDDMVFFAAPDGFIVALDAQTGKVRWETKAHDYTDGTEHSGGLLVADGKIISNRACRRTREGCFIAAHDAKTGKELWKFYNTASPDEPGGDTWGNLPGDKRLASSWGLPGSYDPKRRVVYWAVANPTPYTRLKRQGSADAVSNTSPSELYSNSTVALDINTGKLVWYYQHLPGDDWDSDHIHERTLVHTKVSPDPKFVKWINPTVPKDQERDVVFEVAEAGDVFALDRDTGKFLWASPFPYEAPGMTLKSIDVETGRTHINAEDIFKKEGDQRITCSYNTLYVPFQDACLNMTANNKAPTGAGPRFGIQRPGIDENAYAGIMKINLSTGEMTRIHSQPWPGNGSALVTGGNLLFWGDLNRRLRAFDSDSGKILWEATLGGMIMASTITYAVNGKQYVAVLTGDGQSGTGNVLNNVPKLKANAVRGHNAVHVFALPDKK